MASSAFLRMCPEARARTRTPTAAIANPAPKEVHVGRANLKYAAAKIKPRGTRDRVAIRDQLGMATSQQVASSGDNFFGGNLQQSRFSFTMGRKRGLTFRVPQRNHPGAKWAGASGIGSPVQTDDGNFQRSRKVQRPGISAYQNARATRERNQ